MEIRAQAMKLSQIARVAYLSRKTIRDASTFKGMLGELGMTDGMCDDLVDKLVDRRGAKIESILASVPVEHLRSSEEMIDIEFEPITFARNGTH